MKRCSRGDQCVHPMGCWQPATADFFHRQKRSRDGLNGVCRACKNKDEREYSARYNTKHREKVRERQRRYARSHQPERTEYMREYRKTNRDNYLEYRRAHYAANRERLAQQRRRSADRNRDKVRESNRRSWHKHIEKRHAAQRRYAKENRLKIANGRHRRRARQRSLPDSFTLADWQRAIEYFGACAYCGIVPDSYHADHFIPIAAPNCLGTVMLNMIPSCPSCNLSKSSSDPRQWLTRTFGADRAVETLARIEAYFAWVREQED